MTYGLAGLILYIFISIVVGFSLNTLIISMIGEDADFDDLIADKFVKFFAILILSIFWFISVPIILYNNRNN